MWRQIIGVSIQKVDFEVRWEAGGGRGGGLIKADKYQVLNAAGVGLVEGKDQVGGKDGGKSFELGEEIRRVSGSD
ncbi:MAG: hypothetical protein UY22_C0050G0007 [Candidatus Amesbacteria bacterium GW2011_GWC1_48_10]|uniref:Uncharacterized protein n=1 Tax=Candidatus Amesbacteria bacterium GW2011_GWC1_48_10 TaxID=1618365 RepID=A0A0G1U9D4_9BACT|nr:MAG: hypothetical protein UY22_C0050G0007 [Candidatus Amesbacteria bacterium GW2011_GWC1_48_10]